jgi:RND family efflux transporter MFP subunit
MNPIRLIGKFFAISLLLGVAIGCGTTDGAAGRDGGEGDQPREAVLRVMPIKPVRKTLVRWTEQPGHIEAFEETPLYAKVAGYVEKMHVDIGDPIAGPRFDTNGKPYQEGQLLVELSVPELNEELVQKQAGIGQAQAEIEQAQAAVKVAQAAETSAKARLEEAEAVVDETQAQYDFAHSEFVRMKKLADRGATTRELAEEKEKLFRAADSARRQTQARIASAKAAIAEKEAQIEKATADVEAATKARESAEADLAHVKALLGYTKIRAPYDGVVTDRNVHTGHLVQPGIGSGGKPLLVVAQTRVMRVFVDVPELDSEMIADGSAAEVRIPSFPSEVREGTVTRSSWKLKSDSRTLRVEVDLPNDDGKLRPGMYARAKIKVAERENALLLPKSAILTEERKNYCYTIGEAKKIVKTPIDVGIRAGDDVEILSGLSGDEQVIGVNLSAFREGQEVEVAKPKDAK